MAQDTSTTPTLIAFAVAAALDARRMARHLRLQGFASHADMAWSLVHCHLRRAAAAKAGRTS